MPTIPWTGIRGVPRRLSAARAADRPIFLSIGYAACHWCHVMERESFEDEATAAILNASFVAIKVDREERPDLDSVYMGAVQALTGQGGWPMSVFLDPDGRPVLRRHLLSGHAPPRHAVVPAGARGRASGLDRAAIRARRSGGEGGGGHRRILGGRLDGDSPRPGHTSLAEAMRAIDSAFDPVHGGWGRAPKFPQPMTIEFLLMRHAATGDPRPLAIARRSLDAMADGGIHDQLGGGFHRYSTDASLARAALRADAVRQRPARARLRPCLGCDRG